MERLGPYCVLVDSRVSNQTEQLHAIRKPEHDLSPSPKRRAVTKSNVLNPNTAQMLAQKSLPIRNVISDSVSSHHMRRLHHSQNHLHSLHLSHLFHPRE